MGPRRAAATADQVPVPTIDDATPRRRAADGASTGRPTPHKADAGARTASEVIAERIRSQIATGVLKPGDALPPEDALRELHGVARPTVREALRILESDGLLTIRRGVNGGARVQEPDVATLARRAGLHLQMRGADMDDLYEVHQLLLPGAAGLAARRRSPEQAAALHAWVDHVDASADLVEFGDRAATFLDMVVEASGNRTVTLMEQMMDTLWHRAITTQVQENHAPDDRKVVTWAVGQYRVIASMIEAGEADMVEMYMREHLRRALQLESGEGAQPLQVYGPAPDPPSPSIAAAQARGATALAAGRRRRAART